MKIELHLSLDMIIAANNLLKGVYDLPLTPCKQENVYKSIGFDLADTFEKKCKTQIKKANLFEKKKIKLSLKYHEAWALEAIINDLRQHVHNDYQKNLLIILSYTINQKLA